MLSRGVGRELRSLRPNSREDFLLGPGDETGSVWIKG